MEKRAFERHRSEREHRLFVIDESHKLHKSIGCRGDSKQTTDTVQSDLFCIQSSEKKSRAESESTIIYQDHCVLSDRSIVYLIPLADWIEDWELEISFSSLKQNIDKKRLKRYKECFSFNSFIRELYASCSKLRLLLVFTRGLSRRRSLPDTQWFFSLERTCATRHCLREEIEARKNFIERIRLYGVRTQSSRKSGWQIVLPCWNFRRTWTISFKCTIASVIKHDVDRTAPRRSADQFESIDRHLERKNFLLK